MKMRSLLKKTCLSLSMLGVFAASATAATYYSPVHVFSIDDVQCDTRVYGSADCLDLSNPIPGTKDDYTYFGIDSAYSFTAVDFKPLESKLPIPRDGVYNDGWIANIYDASGNVIGVKAKSPETKTWKAGGLNGAWAAGLGGNSVKASTEHYGVMDHILNAAWMPPMVMGTDYTYKLKDDGKYLFRWGNINKSPSEVRLYTQIPLPEGFVGGNYTVTKATLTFKHRISNSPNDQIRPEDFENEGATGILPQYYVIGNQWFSSVDSVEGDGDFIPAGTLLADFDNPMEIDFDNDGVIDYTDYMTNAWYTTLDRDPWGGVNPRYRFKSSKYGQDLPGVEMEQYTSGDLTTTTIDLLTIHNEETGEIILQNSDNWGDYLDVNPLKGDLIDDEQTIDDCELSDNLDLMMYVKGEYKGMEIYDVQLRVDYIGGVDEGEPIAEEIDVVVSVDGPRTVATDGSKGVKAEVQNLFDSFASGTLRVTGTLLDGTQLYSFSEPFTVDSEPQKFTFRFTAPSTEDTITWSASAYIEADVALDNNVDSDTTSVVGGN
ncbi:hypothetical protein SAMN02745165_02076 [Malonomonas rubra DSM 5091]|uniref:Uncharacterized protein n=1 Tax=Malonomonas rubra DSM 5091 TaxID=1122189 RepID=A0A1M6I9U7_MALRU|nr:hypothetical protein [Malonomonas rubra]SHJ31193.1 hypothetical protein SAMN02745165_02076 [Malonomonas rubra DSM 5091]